ncbi:hypothetical protein CRE_23522 [Caenorhabditis remanei]|uniref:Uncharacterized protein n=1 Tax=Caenorhabditis remanei TaxID=31234 RepID=E3MH61_CAERE|nr:hypothetical protein CRE_23522 [Caenorhabditis remanei]
MPFSSSTRLDSISLAFYRNVGVQRILRSVENNSAAVSDLKEGSIEIESSVEQWSMLTTETQICPIPTFELNLIESDANQSNTTSQCSQEYNSIPPYQYQESNVLSNNDAYQIPSYQPEIYLSSRGVDFSENSAEAITYTTLEPASRGTCPLETPITENPGISCQEESIAHPAGEQQKEAQSDKNSETQEPQKENIQEGQKCTITTCKVKLYLWENYIHPVTKEKICTTCYSYYIRFGNDREVTITKKRRGRKKHFLEGQKCANNVCKRTLLLGKTNVHPVTKEKICKICYNYYKRTGKDREVIITCGRREKHETHPCYDYFKRHGRDREVVAAKVKKLDRDRYESGSDTTSISSDDSSIEESCSIPSCHSLLPLDSTAFHLPSTGMLVCSVCYKLYLKSEYEKVIAAERGAVNEKLECDSPLPIACKSSVENLEEDLMEVESPVEEWNMPAAKTQIYPIPNQPNTEFQYSEEYNYGVDPNSISSYQYQESNVLCNIDAYQNPSYQPEIYINSSGIDFSENSAEIPTYTTLEPASSSICPLETPITENPSISCQEESIAYPAGEQQKEAQSDKNSETQEPQNKNIQEGQKCANNVCKSALFPQKSRPHPVTKEKICTTCYDYHRKTGRDREVIVTRRKREKHETKTCQTYYKRNGKDRELTTTRKTENDETKNSLSETQESQSETIQESQKCANNICKQTLLLGKTSVHPVTKEKICSCANPYCKQPLLPRRNALHPVTQKRVCPACCIYYERNGRDRGFMTLKIRKRESHETNCANNLCQQLLLPKHFRPHPVTKEKLCIACYAYHKKNGKDREKVWTASRRVNETKGFTVIKLKEKKRNNSRQAEGMFSSENNEKHDVDDQKMVGTKLKEL